MCTLATAMMWPNVELQIRPVTDLYKSPVATDGLQPVAAFPENRVSY